MSAQINERLFCSSLQTFSNAAFILCCERSPNTYLHMITKIPSPLSSRINKPIEWKTSHTCHAHSVRKKKKERDKDWKLMHSLSIALCPSQVFPKFPKLLIQKMEIQKWIFHITKVYTQKKALVLPWIQDIIHLRNWEIFIHHRRIMDSWFCYYHPLWQNLQK